MIIAAIYEKYKIHPNLQEHVLRVAAVAQEGELKVAWYADFRVAPYGVTSCDERLDELIKRQKNRGVATKEIQRLEGIKKYCMVLEEELQKKVKIDLSSINDVAVQPVINQIKELTF